MDLSAAGILVGHATDSDGATGVTIVRRHDGAMRAGVAVFGRATGSRELLTASPDHLVNGRADAILLTGGSAYGLDAAAGVMRWMEERRRGFPVGDGVVPIVPAAVLFDLAPLGRFAARPTPQMAYDACESASATDVAEGSVGAGTGATVGKMLGAAASMKGGVGCAVVHGSGGLVVAAVVAVNALGDVRDAAGRIIAGARRADGSFADTAATLRGASSARAAPDHDAPFAMRNTTLALVASSAPLSAVRLSQLARAAGAALFRRITPCGSSSDGDIVFAVSPAEAVGVEPESTVVEALAVAALEQAIERAVRLARGRDGIPGLADRHGN